MSPLGPKQRRRLALGGIVFTLLLAAVFTLGSLDVPLEPRNWRELLALYAVSSFITAALIVFGLILFRTVFRLWLERRREQLGARFKTKMVLGAMVISLLPILFMFFVSYSLLNRTLARWFPRPLEIAAEQSQKLLSDLGTAEGKRLATAALRWSELKHSSATPRNAEKSALLDAADAFWTLDAQGRVERFEYRSNDWKDYKVDPQRPTGEQGPELMETLPSGAEVWKGQNSLLLAGKAALSGGRAALAGREVSNDFLTRLEDIQKQSLAYEQEKQHLRALKTQLLLILFFITVLLFFAVMWMALFLAKQVTVPIQALAEGTREVSSGNFDYQVPAQAQDELGILVRSFNAMTSQLRDSRRQIDEFTRNLQQAVQELERRRQLMETILENIPTGVVSLDQAGNVLRTNSAIAKIFGGPAREARTLETLLGPDAARLVQTLMRRASRMGVVSREVELAVQGHVLHAAVTVSSLGPRRANTGFVVVLDDLTELLRAQKSAAWQEVAQRIAHEIKNPLTPIQLSAQRLARFLERRDQQRPAGTDPRDEELSRLVRECSRMIGQEVTTLASLVDEFSQFVRFPAARLAPTDTNDVVRQSLEVFTGRLDGISVVAHLQEKLPAVRGDSGLLRSVIVNLIDNAAEALEDSPLKEIRVSTRALAETDAVEICVEDTGHGISPEDKDRLFLPKFSTRGRGTGLGLAIAARIVAEHGGTIRVEDNHPVGSRFLVVLPAMEAVPAHGAERA